MSLETYRRDMICCTRCGFCKVIFGPMQKSWRFNNACPIHKRYAFDSYSGQGLLSIAYDMLDGKLGYVEGLIELIYKCTMCGFCDYACKWVHANAEVLDIILELRAKVVEDGKGPMPQHKKMAKNVATHHNIYGKPHEERFNWNPREVEIAKKADTAYFVGCITAYVKPEIAQATTKILKAGGEKFTVLHPNEYCCGCPLWRTGQREAAREVMEHNVKAIRESGVKALVTSCAECYGTFKREYPKVVGTLDFEVLHITELMKKMIEAGKLKLTKRVDMRVTYHDPCLLGRLGETYIPWKGEVKKFGVHVPPKVWLFGTNGVYEPPREVLRAIPGIELVEMERTREYSWCCGAGGGVKSVFPDFALWTAGERIEEAKVTAAEAIVSCCPNCAINFEGAIAHGKERMGFYDLTELVLKALG